MNNKVILPIGESCTQAWPETNFLMSILAGVDGGWEWVLNTHIQLRYSIFKSKKWNLFDSRITFYPYGMHDLTPNIFDLCPFVDKYVIPRKTVFEQYPSPLEFVDNALRENYYVSTYMDQFFRKDIRRKGFYHPNYVYGIDMGKKEIYLMDNFEHGKFQHKKLSLSDFLDAFRQVTGNNWEAGVFLYKVKKADFHFSLSFVLDQLKDYLYPQEKHCYFHRMICPEFQVDNEEKFETVGFGIGCYDFLIDYVNRSKDGRQNCDIRFFCIMEDHKYLMLMRYEYMVQKNIMDHDVQLQKELEELLQAFRTMKNLYLKYIMTNRYNILQEIAENLIMLKKKDKKCTEILISAIERNI